MAETKVTRASRTTRDIDPMELGAALAMRNAGFSDSDIIAVLGYLPDMNITVEELEASVLEAPELAPSR
jgi:hypothetical protein